MYYNNTIINSKKTIKGNNINVHADPILGCYVNDHDCAGVVVRGADFLSYLRTLDHAIVAELTQEQADQVHLEYGIEGFM